MSEKREDSAATGIGSKPLEYAERVDHFAAGYNNSQSVVRFLDTKASAVVGVVPVVIGLLVGVYRWFDSSWNLTAVMNATGKALPAALLVALTVMAAWLLLRALQAVNAAFEALSPQPPKKTLPSVLFPYQVEKDTTLPAASPDVDFASRSAHFQRDANQSDALEDYHRQIVRMSEIVKRKLTYVGEAIAHLKVVIRLALGIVAILFIMATGSALIPLDAATEEAGAASATSASSRPIASPTTQP